MTATQKRTLTDQLHREAAARGLRLEHRERTARTWVWDIRDEARGTLAVRGVSLQQAAACLGVQA